MNRRLKRRERFHIVAAMKKSACLLMFLLVAAPAALAQSSQFGLLLGGSKRLVSNRDEEAGRGVSDSWKFSNSVKEAYYAIELEPGTMFKIKGGQISAPAAFRVQTGNASSPQVVVARRDLEKADIDHIDALIDYRFSEAFGSTGLFAGVGLYRQQGTFAGTSDVLPQDRDATETNYGFSGGVNGDFPLSKRYGVVVEATYHWVNYHYRPRYITLTGGFRISF
jgi:hypothetical protein